MQIKHDYARSLISVLLLVSLCKSALAQQPASSLPSSAPKVTVKTSLSNDHDKDFSAVVAAPSEIVYPISEAFPVIVQVYQIGKLPLPEKVRVTTQLGTFVGSGSQGSQIDIPAKLGRQTVLLSLPERGVSSNHKIHISVTDINNPFDYFGAGTDILLRQQEYITVVASPSALPANGKAIGTITVRVADINGKGISHVPCIISSLLPGDIYQRLSAAESNEQGNITFSTPTTDKAGLGLFQFVTEVLASNQITVHYERVTAASSIVQHQINTK